MPPLRSHPPRPPSRTPSGPFGTPTDTEGDEDDEDEEASIASDDRSLLRWDRHDCWLPIKKGMEQITTVFKSCYNWYVPHFHLAPQEAIDTWWDEWKKAFRFRKAEADMMRDTFLARASKRLRELFHGIREKGYPSHWIPDDIFKRLKEYWASPEYQAMKRTNKANRASVTGGSLHTEGSITYPATTENMSQKLGRTPTQSEQLYDDEIKRLEEERAELIAAGCPEPPPIDYDAVWLRIVGGRKRGRVYGRGKWAVDMREQVTLLNRELTQQAEENKQEVVALRTQHASDLARLQSTIDSQSAEFDRWKNTVTQMYNFMQTMHPGTSSSIPGMPSPMPPPPPPPPLHPRSSSATEQPTPDADRSPHLDRCPHDDSDYV
ncbi:hypothetical protein PIB30_011356 [Stylosanthes scabra]|uniref:Uncharacterized protein n=1 Tax=Stylosanthes scabra TaxID=79078 RepID=A0ABU6X773_9FABA|nr:hypothetical protein [Stylosanthes scabra]